MCLHFIFDYTTLISEGTIKEMTENIGKQLNKVITFEIRDSKTFYPLQTNDFVIGSLGKKYNRKDDRCINSLKTKVDRKRLIMKRFRFF